MQSTRLLGLLFDKRRGFEEIYTSVEIFSKNAHFPLNFIAGTLSLLSEYSSTQK